MEFIGETFQLVPNESSILIIEGAYFIYRKWMGLNYSNDQQLVIPSHTLLNDEIIGIIGRHLSLLFENKICNPKVKDKYLNICENSLYLYKWIIQSKSLSFDLLIEICKLLIGILNELIINKKDHICENLIELSCKILFDAFILSGIQDRQLYDSLSNFCSIWMNNSEFMEIWSSFAFGLSQGLLTFITVHDSNENIKNSEKEILVKIDRKIQDCSLNYLIDKAHLCYLWYKIVFILNNIFILDSELISEQNATKIQNIKRLYKTLQDIIQLFIEFNESSYFVSELLIIKSKKPNIISNFDSKIHARISPKKIENQQMEEELNIQ